MEGKVFDRINDVKNLATKTEKVLIEKVNTLNKNEVIYMSISELSEILGVAEATLLRFCRKLGYKGFQDFKLNLCQDIAVEAPPSDDVSKSVASTMCLAISNTCEQINYADCEAVAKKIISAKKVCFFGVGNSSVATLASKLRLIKVGINVENSSDPHMQTIITSNLDRDDVIVLVSVSGSTKDILNLAEIAKSNGTTVVVITNYGKSPLAKNADYVFITSKKEAAYDGGTLATIGAQLYVVDLLCICICELLGNEAENRTIKSSMEVSGKAL